MSSSMSFTSQLATVATVLFMATNAAHAQQGQSMEERLRNQLRITTSQLQEAQNELATLKAGKGALAGTSAASSDSKKPTAVSADVDNLKKELDQAKAQLSAERRSREKNQGAIQSATQGALEKANAQSTQYRNAYDELLKLARAAETERQRLAQEQKSQQNALAQCVAKNTQLYAVGQEILQAYETMDVATILAARQPFAAQSRVKYEQIAQQYGDKLYEGRFDVRSVAVPAVAMPNDNAQNTKAQNTNAQNAASTPPAPVVAQ